MHVSTYVIYAHIQMKLKTYVIYTHIQMNVKRMNA